MHILGGTWQDGYLDEYRAPGELRVAVRAWWNVLPLRDVYLEQPRSVRRVINYVREVGVVQTLRKVRSRWAEKLRDRRFAAIGLGEVVEADGGSRFSSGQRVVFLAPCHPECIERVVLPPRWIAPAADDAFERHVAPGVIVLRNDPTELKEDELADLAGWRRESGIEPGDGLEQIVGTAARIWQQAPPSASERRLPLPTASSIRERRATPARRDGRSAVLFGLGNYAKTCVLPNLDPGIHVDCIHEIDPTQMGIPADGPAYDTSPTVRGDEQYDVYCIAGYHHTHADLAVHALRSGAHAVVEKPLVTTWEQLERLIAAMREHPGRYFAGFHMRHNPLWRLAREDLDRRPGEPIHYHCIVFEVPLVRRHWYNWPTSRSRIVSNGCHWLDHFLFMNDYAASRRSDLWRGGNGDLHVSVELENGAVMSMALTDHGSRRIGVQDHIQLRAGEVTVRVDNGGRYVAEDRFRVLRRTRINKMQTVNLMYQTISRRIVNGEPGDSLESTQRTCELMLTLQDKHTAVRGETGVRVQ